MRYLFRMLLLLSTACFLIFLSAKSAKQSDNFLLF
jgi:hypothetical protein